MWQGVLAENKLLLLGSLLGSGSVGRALGGNETAETGLEESSVDGASRAVSNNLLGNGSVTSTSRDFGGAGSVQLSEVLLVITYGDAVTTVLVGSESEGMGVDQTRV